MVEVPPFNAKFRQDISVFVWNPYQNKKFKASYPIELKTEQTIQYFEVKFLLIHLLLLLLSITYSFSFSFFFNHKKFRKLMK